jgi:uncharacterized protein
MLTTLSQSESHTLLRNGRVARLGCVIDGEPYVVPVNYYIEGDYAYFHSLPGRKLEALRTHPRACLQIDDITDEARWRSVLAYGTYEEIENLNERGRILNEFFKRFPLLTPVESAMVQDVAPPPVVVFRIRIETVTGVRDG